MPKVIHIEAVLARIGKSQGDVVELSALDDTGQVYRYVFENEKWVALPTPTSQHRFREQHDAHDWDDVFDDRLPLEIRTAARERLMARLQP